MTSVFEELKESRDQLISKFSAGEISDAFQEDYTEILDHYFRRSLQESSVGHTLFKKKTPFALVAAGGYGRKELCLHSDIDILILFRNRIPRGAGELVEEIFYPLWDLDFDIGYGTRTIKDSLTLSKNDFEVLTSMMNARFICGDSQLYHLLLETLEKKVISKKANAFRRWLEDRDKIRMDTSGDASHLLEPNLKEGIGGLRDYHHILWLGRAFFDFRAPRDLEDTGKLSHNEYQILLEQLQFIWLVRNHLHLLSGRKNDRLGFEFQEKIAQVLDYKKKKDLMAVEQFMGKLHASMASIKSLHRSFVNGHFPKKNQSKKALQPKEISSALHLYQDEICFNTSKDIIEGPFLLINIFEQSSRLGYRLSMESRRLVKEFLYLVDHNFRESDDTVQSFLTIMKGEDSFQVLDQMYETGLLDVFLPEFGKVRERVQFDTYHIFPVGMHLLETVRYLKELKKRKDFSLLDIFSELPNPELLFLAGLFHDIGKTGKDHSRKGIGITRKILQRFGYDRAGTRDILFLVGYHLLLVETATRRDLNDEKVVVQCARLIENPERLKMLYLLTWADSKATGPKAWNEWIANLVQELFFKVLRMLESGELATMDASRKVKGVKKEVSQMIPSGISPRDLDHHFEVMSPRYLLNTTPKGILRHLELVQLLKRDIQAHGVNSFILESEEDESRDSWEITFMAKDRPGIFSDIAGVLALHNISILSAHIYTWRDGTVVDIFRVTNPLDPIHPSGTWNRVKRDLRNVFTGKLSLPYRLGQKAGPSILKNHGKPSRPPQVLVDSESSDFFTLIEVFAEDRIGLLYDITHTLFNLRLDIRIAKIATKGDLIADVFYVRDMEGQKIEDREQVKEIKGALLHQLAPYMPIV